MKGNRLAIYSRVSTSDQSVDMQLTDLRRFAEARGFVIVHEYADTGIGGAVRKRPALDSLMDAARKRQFDVVAVWRFDRFGQVNEAPTRRPERIPTPWNRLCVVPGEP